MRSLVLLTLLFLGSVLHAKQREIPLSDIWASNMPGTKNVLFLEQDLWEDGDWVRWSRQSLVASVQDRLIAIADTEPIAGEAIVVPGTGLKALENVYQRLLGEEVPPISSATESSVFFYSTQQSPITPVVNRVTVRADRLEIDYIPVLPGSIVCTTPHFALIPVGKQSPGRKRVAIQGGQVRLLFHQPKPDAHRVDQYVCKPTSFVVQRGKSSGVEFQPPANRRQESQIPLADVWSLAMPWTRGLEELVTDPEGAENQALVWLNKHLEHFGQGASLSLSAGEPGRILQCAVAALKGDDVPPCEFRVGDPLMAFLCSPRDVRSLRIISIVKRPGRIIIYSQRVVNTNTRPTYQAALIPLGTPPPGGLRVEVIELPTVSCRGDQLDLSRFQEERLHKAVDTTILKREG